MANTKISNLTGAASVTDNSVFPVVDSGSTKKVTGTQIKTYARSGLSTVATSGSYNDLTGKPTLFNGAYASLTGKPTLFDGNYNSLTNRPSLFDGSYNSLTDTPTIFDGNYDSLTNKPIISDTNGLTGGTFFIAKDSTTIQLGQWAAQAITIGSSGIQIAGTGGVEIAGVAGAGITLGGETSGTITVNSATSGINYNDLTNKPTIPTDVSDLTDTNSLLSSGTTLDEYGNFYTGNFFAAGAGFTGYGGSVYIRASRPDAESTLDFEFKENGQFKLPPGGDIVDSTGMSVLSATTDRLVNGDYSFILNIHGGIDATNGTIGPTQAGEFGFGADTGANAVIKANGGFSTWTFKSDNTLQLPAGGDIVDTNGTSVLGGGGGASTGSITFVDNSILGTGDVVIGFDIVASPAVSFSFTQTGEFIAPKVVTDSVTTNQFDMYYTRQVSNVNTVECPPNVDTVIYTGTDQWQHTFKLLLKVEGNEVSGQEGWDTQSCEMMIAKSFRNDTMAGSVYGLVYTSANPLATFTTQWNSAINRVEVLCRPTSTTENVAVRSFVTEMTTSD